MIDITKVRKDTRYCEEQIFFNNAGAALMPIPVADSLQNYLKREEREGGYETAESEAASLARFYDAFAETLNCKNTEIAYIENATRAWDLAFYSFDFKPGDKILTTRCEYGSNLIAYQQLAKRKGIKYVFVPNDEHGQTDTKALANLIDEKIKLISATHIPTGGGLVNPAKAIGEIARSAQIPFLLDACQSVGQIPMDVQEIACDILTGTGRKYLRGPRGTGFLYIRDTILDSLEPIILDQHAAEIVSLNEHKIRADAKRFESWEQYFAGKKALAVAADYASGLGLENIRDRIYTLAEELRAGLANITNVENQDLGQEKCGIVTFTVTNKPCIEVKQALAKYNIKVSLSRGSGSFISFKDKGIKELIRVSLHYYNTEQETHTFLQRLDQIVNH